MRGVVRVLGGAGTGRAACSFEPRPHTSPRARPESVLLLTGFARLGAQARAAITSALLGAGERAVVRGPLVGTVHSYAFAVLRLAAQRNGDPPPRLITSAEGPLVRELLAGDSRTRTRPPAGRRSWRTRRAASDSPPLRDLSQAAPNAAWIPLSSTPRAARGPPRMAGRRPVRTGLRTDHAAALRGRMAAPQATVPALGAAELVGAALEAFAPTPTACQRTRSHRAASCRRRAASRSAGRPAGAGAVRGRRTRRHRRRPQPVGIRFPAC